VLSILQELLITDREFFRTCRFLDNTNRNLLVAAHMRNSATAMSILHLYMTQPETTTMVMNIPINMDMSGNFFDPVPVIPTREQIDAATETHMGVPANTTCAICQEEVTCATRIRACGHTFHGACLDQWLQMNPRCPVCRHDIRDLQSTASVSHNEDSGMHSY